MGVWSDAGPRGDPEQVGRLVSMQRRPGDTVQGTGVGGAAEGAQGQLA